MQNKKLNPYQSKFLLLAVPITISVGLMTFGMASQISNPHIRHGIIVFLMVAFSSATVFIAWGMKSLRNREGNNKPIQIR